MEIRIYERGGDKAEQAVMKAAAAFFANELMTQGEQADLLVKVKRVHCRNAMNTTAGGESFTGEFGPTTKNTDMRIKNLRGRRAVYVKERAFRFAKDGAAVVTVRRRTSDGEGRRPFLAQLSTLAHEMVHVAQKQSGRMRILFGMNSKEQQGLPQVMWTDGDGWVEVKDSRRPQGMFGPCGKWGRYWDLPWEVEARSLQVDLTRRFIEFAKAGAAGHAVAYSLRIDGSMFDACDGDFSSLARR